MNRKYRDLCERIVANSVVIKDYSDTHADCWVWLGRFTKRGYPRLNLRVNGKHKTKLAHRVAWESFNGQIPGNLTIEHKCRRPACVNPSHMELLSRADNSKARYVLFDRS